MPAPGATAVGKLHTAWAVLAAACATAGFDHTGARLIRFVGNAVFRLAHHPVVVKIALSPRLWHRASTALTAARVLAAHRVPAVRPAAHTTQPVYIGSYAVTFWAQIHDDGPPPAMTDLAGLLTQLHHIPLHHIPATGLTIWNPVPDLWTRIADAQDTDPHQLRYLLERCDDAADKLAGLRYQLPRAVIHGDAHLGNLIASPTGPVLCDLDTTSIGPPEWDLVPAAVAALRFPDRREDHRQLAQAYGFDVTTWDGFPTLRLIRELKLVTSALPQAATNLTIRAQLHHRLRTLPRRRRHRDLEALP